MELLSRGPLGARGSISTAVGLALVGGMLACGPGMPSVRYLPGAGTARLEPIYDVMATYPDTTIIVAGLPYRGLELDIEVTFDDPTLRDDDEGFEARGRIVSISAGGVPQAFEAPQPIAIRGTLTGGFLATGFFGPIHVGNVALLLDLTGPLRDGSRRIVGDAALYGIPDSGSFVAVKRRRYLVAGTDMQGPIGKVAVVEVRYDSRITLQPDLEVTSSDPIARVEDGRPVIVNRFTFDNLQGLDPIGSFTTLFEHSTGSLSNPHDVVIPPSGAAGIGGSGTPGDAGLAFVTRYGAAFNDVAIVDLKDGEVVDRIDLVPFARNRDHLPRADQALWHDGLVYVTLQDANAGFDEFLNGRVAVIDPVLRQVIDVIDLSGQNPFESLSFSEETGLIYVGLAGLFPGLASPTPVLSGGIETIDPETRTAQGLLVDDNALGGNVSSVAIHSASRGYCVVSDASFHNFVKAFDPTTGTVLGTIFESTGQIASVEADGDGYLLVADTSLFDPRILIFNAENGAPIAALPARLPPFSFAILTRSLP